MQKCIDGEFPRTMGQQHEKHDEVIKRNFETVVAGAETVRQVYQGDRNHHDDHQRNRNEAGKESQREQHDARRFRRGGQVRLQRRQRQPHGAEPFGHGADIAPFHFGRFIKTVCQDQSERKERKALKAVEHWGNVFTNF